MPEETVAEQDNTRTRERREQPASHAGENRDLAQPPASDAPYPTSLLNDPRSRSSYNRPVRAAIIGQEQQSYGNRAVQRWLAAHEQGSEGNPTESRGERAVQRWLAARQAALPVQTSKEIRADPALAIPTSPGPLNLQLKSIKSGENPVGEYDGLGGLESSYQSSWEGEKKSVGVSYRMLNARRQPGNAPMPNAVAHAHVTGNGKNIGGVSVKAAPGGGGAQWVSPAALNPGTANELVAEMNAQNPNPIQVTNMRKVMMVTDVWSDPPHRRSDKAKVFETVYIAQPGGFVEEKKMSAELIYDVANGRYKQSDMYATREEAQQAADLMPIPVAPPRAAPAPPPSTAPEPDETEEEETEATAPDPRAAEKAAKRRARKQRQREAQKQKGKAEAQSPVSTPPQASPQAPTGESSEEETPQAAAGTTGLRAWISWAISWLPGTGSAS